MRNAWRRRGEAFYPGAPVLVMLCVFFVLGIGAGSYSVRFVSSRDMGEIAAAFQDFSALAAQHKGEFKVLFFSLFSDSTKLAACLFGIGFTMLAPALTTILICYKGFSVGFAACCILSSLETHPYQAVFSNILLHNMLILPILLLVGTESILFSKQLLSRLKGPVKRDLFVEEEMKRYFLHFILSLALLFVCCLAAAFLMQIIPWSS